MKSELERAINSKNDGLIIKKKFEDSIKGYPSFMKSPNKRLNSQNEAYLENPWDDLYDRVLDLEEDPITDESMIIRELDETIRSIVQPEEKRSDIQSEEFEHLLEPDLKKQVNNEAKFQTPSKNQKLDLLKSTKALIEQKLGSHLLPIQDLTHPQNSTEKEQKDFHMRKAKELRRLQYVTGLKKDEMGNIMGNTIVSRTRRHSPNCKSSAKRRRSSRTKFRSNSKKLMNLEHSNQQQNSTTRKRSRSRGNNYLELLRSSDKSQRKTPSRKRISRKSSTSKKSIQNSAKSESLPYSSSTTTKKVRNSRKNREKISSLANQLYSNPLISKKEKLSLIYQLESLLNSELEQMDIQKSMLMRTDPEEQHPVWIDHKGTIYPAMIKCMNGFKLNHSDADLLEVREGDVVTIKVNETSATACKEKSDFAAPDLPFKFCGDIKKLNDSESVADADFVVDDNEGGRFLVLIYLRNEETLDYIESPPKKVTKGESIPNKSSVYSAKAHSDEHHSNEEKHSDRQSQNIKDFEQYNTQKLEVKKSNLEFRSIDRNCTESEQRQTIEDPVYLSESEQENIPVQQPFNKQEDPTIVSQSEQKMLIPIEAQSDIQIITSPGNEEDIEIHRSDPPVQENQPEAKGNKNDSFQPHPKNKIDEQKDEAELEMSKPKLEELLQKEVKYDQKTSNCMVYSPIDIKPMFKAVAILSPAIPGIGYNFTTKAILVNGDNQTSFILLSLPYHLGKMNVKTSIQFQNNQSNPEYLMVKTQNSQKFEKFQILNVQSYPLVVSGGIAKVITLVEPDQSKLPSVVYFIDGVEFLGQSSLLQGQKVEIHSENNAQLKGEILSYEKLQEQRALNTVELYPGYHEEQEQFFLKIQQIQNNINENSRDCDFIIVKLDPDHVKPNPETNKIGLKNQFVLLLMDKMSESVSDEKDFEQIFLVNNPHPVDPEMIEEDTGRILIQNEVLMTKMLCKIQDLVRENMKERVENNKESINSSVSSFKDELNNDPKMIKAESKVLSPRKLQRIQHLIEGSNSIENIEQNILKNNSISEYKSEVDNISDIKSSTSQLELNQVENGRSVNEVVPTENEDEIEENEEVDPYQAKKNDLIRLIAKLKKKKANLQDKQSKNDSLIQREREKLEKKKEQIALEKSILDEQKKKQLAKLIGKPLLQKKAEATFDKYEKQIKKKEEKLILKESKLKNIKDDLDEKTAQKQARIEAEILAAREEIAMIEAIQKENSQIKANENIIESLHDEKEEAEQERQKNMDQLKKTLNDQEQDIEQLIEEKRKQLTQSAKSIVESDDPIKDSLNPLEDQEVMDNKSEKQIQQFNTPAQDKSEIIEAEYQNQVFKRHAEDKRRDIEAGVVPIQEDRSVNKKRRPPSRATSKAQKSFTSQRATIKSKPINVRYAASKLTQSSQIEVQSVNPLDSEQGELKRSDSIQSDTFDKPDDYEHNVAEHRPEIYLSQKSDYHTDDKKIYQSEMVQREFNCDESELASEKSISDEHVKTASEANISKSRLTYESRAKTLQDGSREFIDIGEYPQKHPDSSTSKRRSKRKPKRDTSRPTENGYNHDKECIEIEHSQPKTPKNGENEANKSGSQQRQSKSNNSNCPNQTLKSISKASRSNTPHISQKQKDIHSESQSLCKKQSKDHSSKSEEAIEKEITEEMEKRIQMHKELLRQELSETKSKILENLGQTSESEQTENENKQFLLNESVNKKFQKKTDSNKVFVSPKPNQKVEDSMALSSSSSKKKSTIQKNSPNTDDSQKADKNDNFFKQLKEQISDIEILQESEAQTDIDIQQSIEQNSQNTKLEDAGPEGESNQENLPHQSELSNKFKKSTKNAACLIPSEHKEDENSKEEAQMRRVNKVPTTSDAAGEVEFTEVAQVYQNQTQTLENNASPNDDVIEQKVIIHKRKNNPNEKVVENFNKDSLQGSQKSFQNNPHEQESSALSHHNLQQQNTSDSELERDLQKLNESNSSDYNSEDARYSVDIRNKALDEARSFISNNIKSVKSSKKNLNEEHNKELKKKTQPGKVVIIDGEEINIEEEEQQVCPDSKAQIYVGVVPGRDRGETEINLGDFVGIGNKYEPTAQQQEIEISESENDIQIVENANKSQVNKSHKKNDLFPKLKALDTQIVKSEVYHSEVPNQEEHDLQKSNPYIEDSKINKEEKNQFMSNSLKKGQELENFKSYSNEQNKPINSNCSGKSKKEHFKSRPHEEHSYKSSRRSHTLNDSSEHGQFKGNLVRQLTSNVPSGQEQHYSRININLNIDSDREVEFEGYGRVTLRSSNKQSPEKASQKTKKTNFTSQILSPTRIREFAHTSPPKVSKSAISQKNKLSSSKSKFIHKVENRVSLFISQGELTFQQASRFIQCYWRMRKFFKNMRQAKAQERRNRTQNPFSQDLSERFHAFYKVSFEY